MQHYSFVCLVIIDVSNESKSFFFTVFAVGNIKQRRSNVSHRSVGVVEFVPDDGGDSLEGFLWSDPGRHAGVEDDAQLAVVFLTEPHLLLDSLVHALVALQLPGGGVEDDLNSPVHHARLLVRVGASLHELGQELSLLGHGGVVHPATRLGVPVPEVDWEAVYLWKREIILNTLQRSTPTCWDCQVFEGSIWYLILRIIKRNIIYLCIDCLFRHIGLIAKSRVKLLSRFMIADKEGNYLQFCL